MTEVHLRSDRHGALVLCTMATSKSKSVTRALLKALKVGLLAAVAAIVLLYGWAFMTLDWADLRVTDDRHGEFFSNRKIGGIGKEGSHRSEAPLVPPEPEQPVHGRHGLGNRTLSFAYPDDKYRIYSLPEKDSSARCRLTGICDGDYSCGKDGLGCVTNATLRQDKVREAARWSWIGYRCVLGGGTADAGCVVPSMGVRACACTCAMELPLRMHAHACLPPAHMGTCMGTPCMGSSACKATKASRVCAERRCSHYTARSWAALAGSTRGATTR